MKSFSLSIAAGFLMLAAALPARANLLADASFETPAVAAGGFTLFNTGTTIGSAWSVVGAPGNVGVVSGTFTQFGFSFPAQDGTQWLDLTGLSSNHATGVQQTVSTTTGTTYNLSFWVGNIVDNGSTFGTTSTVDVLINGVLLLAAQNTGGTTTQNWKEFTTSFTATSTSTILAFLNGDPASDNSNGLDNIDLTEGGTGGIPTGSVPEPGSMLLLASSALLWRALSLRRSTHRA